MSDPFDEFAIPDALGSGGDPVDENPFPAGSNKHIAWADATVRAEMELSELNRVHANYMGSLSPEGGQRSGFLEEFCDRTVRYCAARFDIWARRYINVVWNDLDVRGFDQWLLAYAQASLKSLADGQKTRIFVPAMQPLLMERVEYWKVEARRFVAHQQAIDNPRMAKIDAGWLRIETKRLRGATLAECLSAAYDHHAEIETEAESPLTEAVISSKLPPIIFMGAIRYKWIPYPLRRPVGTKPRGGFLNGWCDLDATEEIPDTDLAELFMGERVPQGYEDEFRRLLVHRMEHWRGVNGNADEFTANRAAANAEPDFAADVLRDPGAESLIPRAMVDAFLKRVVRESGLAIKRVHIWKQVHQRPRQFQYWQASDPKATAEDDRNFRRILSMSTMKFVGTLKKLNLIKG